MWYRKRGRTLRSHVLKKLYEYNGGVSVDELTREIDRVGEYKGSPQNRDYLARSVRFALEVLRMWGKVKRETCPRRKFGGGLGSTPKYLYSIRPAGVLALKRQGMI